MSDLTVYIDQFLHSTWTQNVGWMLLHSLWQITLIATLYAVSSVGLRNRSASLRYLIGCVAMVAMLVVPVGTLCMLPIPSQRVAVEIGEFTTAGSNDSVERLLTAEQYGQEAAAVPIGQPILNSGFKSQTGDLAIAAERPSLLQRVMLLIQPWLPIATVIWLLGVLLLSLRPVLGCLRVQTLRSSGLTPLSDSHCQLAKRLVTRLGIRHVVQFAQSALVEVPTVIGYLRPMLLLPASSVTGLTTAELELILAHELAHIRRHDYALNLIQTVIEALLFYHPGMWWVSSQVRRERENCCDDVAVAISGDRVTYIRALAQLEEHRVAPPALSASGGSLLMRVRRLLDQPQSEFGYRKSSLWLTVLILGVSLTVAAYAGTLSGGASDPPAEPTPAKGDEVSGDDDSVLNFEKQVGQKVAQVIRQAELPFVDEQRLADIETDFAKFISSEIPSGTFAVGISISADQRTAILSAIEKHGAKHLGIDRYRQGDLRSINGAYLGLPDRLLTLKWKLHQAIIHARALDADKQARLEAQRSWMKEHIQSLSSDKFSNHQRELSELEERLADPLCCTLGYPMDDEQFGIFQQKLQKYASQKSELRHVVSHIVQQSLFAKYQDSGDVQLPFKDRVGGKGAGRFVHLSFMSNRPFESSLRSIDDIGSSGTVIDATTGYLVSAPKDSRDADRFERWLSYQSKGDFGFDDANGGSLIATRGAKLMKLDVKTWVEADAISNDELKTLLNGPKAGRTVSLKKHYQDYQQDNGAPYCYVGVLTKEGRLAVVAVEDFSGGSSIGVRTRVRSTLPELITEELADGEVTLSFDRPAHWVDSEILVEGVAHCSYHQPKPEVDGTRASIKAQFQDYGHPYSVDVTTKQNLAATVSKVLTVDGEPARLISFRLSDSLPPQEHMRLLFGKGTRGYDVTFIFPTSQRQQYVELALAVSKSIRIRATKDEMKEDADPTDHTLRIKGQFAQSGTVSGRVEGNVGSYNVTLEHELWKNNLGVLPNIVVKSGETFEFTNVPVGECTVTANPVLVINDIKRERTHFSKTVEVKDGQTATADLIDSSEPETSNGGKVDPNDAEKIVEGKIREARKQLIGQWVGGGAIMPVYHTFSADGSYERRIVDDPPEHGTWRLENGRLTRQIDGQEHSSKQIKWMDPNFFRFIETNGDTSGYHRIDEATGRVILDQVAKGINVIDANQTLRWDRLKPKNEHARVLREWDNIPYEKARAAGISKTAELPEIWEEVPPGSKSYEVRKDVRAVSPCMDIIIYHRPDLDRFWVQRDPGASSFMTYFGPFDGDPSKVLDGKLEIRVEPNEDKPQPKATKGLIDEKELKAKGLPVATSDEDSGITQAISESTIDSAEAGRLIAVMNKHAAKFPRGIGTFSGDYLHKIDGAGLSAKEIEDRVLELREEAEAEFKEARLDPEMKKQLNALLSELRDRSDEQDLGKPLTDDELIENYIREEAEGNRASLKIDNEQRTDRRKFHIKSKGDLSAARYIRIENGKEGLVTERVIGRDDDRMLQRGGDSLVGTIMDLQKPFVHSAKHQLDYKLCTIPFTSISYKPEMFRDGYREKAADGTTITYLILKSDLATWRLGVDENDDCCLRSFESFETDTGLPLLVRKFSQYRTSSDGSHYPFEITDSYVISASLPTAIQTSINTGKLLTTSREVLDSSKIVSTDLWQISLEEALLNTEIDDSEFVFEFPSGTSIQDDRANK